MRLTKIFVCAIVAATLVALVGQRAAEANLVMYADTFGNDVSFTSITETSTAAGPWYGQPVGVGNTALSPGIGFLSQAANAQLEMINGRLQMTIAADPGFLFNSIRVDQLGSFLSFGLDASVLASSNATVVTPDGNFGGSLFFSNVGDGAGPWSDDFTVNFPATNVVAFTLDHQLLSAAGLGSGAFIDTSSIQVSVSGFVVPEANTVVFLAFAAAGLGICRRRRQL